MNLRRQAVIDAREPADGLLKYLVEEFGSVSDATIVHVRYSMARLIEKIRSEARTDDSAAPLLAKSAAENCRS